jgi:SOS response regulatory protein OraA/RecX
MQTFRDKGFRLLGKREYSVHEFRKKLIEKFPKEKEGIEEFIVELKQKKFLSNERFCALFIEDQVLKRSAGPRKIIQKLRMKSIFEDMAKKAVEEHFLLEDQIEIAKELIAKKEKDILRRKKDITEFELSAKLKEYLYGRGFGGEVTDEVL